MSSMDSMVVLVKELGFAGIALYALWVMNNLNNSINDMKLVIQKLCEKVNI